MNEEDTLIQQELVEEIMKASEQFPNVILYMETVMESYEELEQENNQLKEVIEKISNNILNETTTFCESCASKDCCPEEDCVLYRIEKLVDKVDDIK